MRALTILWSNFGALIPFTISSLGLGYFPQKSTFERVPYFDSVTSIRGLENESSHGEWGSLSYQRSRRALRGEAWQGKAGYDRRRPPDSVPCPVAMPAHQPACLLVVPIPDCRACSFLRPPSVGRLEIPFIGSSFSISPRPARPRPVRLSICLVRRVVRRLGFSMRPAAPARAATALNGLEVPARGPAVVQDTSNAR